MEVRNAKFYDENASSNLNKASTPKSSKKNRKHKSFGLQNSDFNRNVQQQEADNMVKIDSTSTNKTEFSIILSKPAAQLDDPSPVKEIKTAAPKPSSKPPVAKFTKGGMRQSLITFADTPKHEDKAEVESVQPSMTPWVNDKMSTMTPAAHNNSRKQYAGRTPKHNYSADVDSDSDASSQFDVMGMEMNNSSPSTNDLIPCNGNDTPVLDELKAAPVPTANITIPIEIDSAVTPTVLANRVESPSVTVPALSMQHSSRRPSASPVMPTPTLAMDVQVVAPLSLPAVTVTSIESDTTTPVALTVMEPVAKMPSPTLAMPTLFTAPIPAQKISEPILQQEIVMTVQSPEVLPTPMSSEPVEEEAAPVVSNVTTTTTTAVSESQLETSLITKAVLTIANTEEILRLTDPNGVIAAPQSACSSSDVPVVASIPPCAIESTVSESVSNINTIVVEKDPTFEFNPMNTNSGVFAPSSKNTRKILNNSNKPMESVCSDTGVQMVGNANAGAVIGGINTAFPVMPSTPFQNKAIHNNSTKVNPKVEQAHTEVIPTTSLSLDVNRGSNGSNGASIVHVGPSRALNRYRTPVGSNMNCSAHPVGISVNMSAMRPSATTDAAGMQETLHDEVLSNPNPSGMEVNIETDEVEQESSHDGPNVTVIIENQGVKPHIPRQNHHYQPHTASQPSRGRNGFSKDNKNFNILSNTILPSNQTWGSQMNYQHRDALSAPDMNATSLGYYKTNDAMQKSGRRRHEFGSSSSTMSTDSNMNSLHSGMESVETISSEASSEFVYDLTTANHFEIESEMETVPVSDANATECEGVADTNASICSYTSSSTKNHNDTTITLNDVFNDFQSTPMMVVTSAKEMFISRQAAHKSLATQEEHVELEYEDENRGDMKELLLVGEEINKATTIKLTYGNKKKGGEMLCIKSRAVQMRFDPYHCANTTGYMSAITPIKCNNTPDVCSFEVSPYKLDVAPDTVGTTYITFTPKAYGVYSGALKLTSNNKSFVILLRGECKNSAPAVAPMMSNVSIAMQSAIKKEQNYEEEEQDMESSVDSDGENSILECLQAFPAPTPAPKPVPEMERSIVHSIKPASERLPPRSPAPNTLLYDALSAMKSSHNMSNQCDVSVSTCFSSDEPHACSMQENADYDSMGASNMDSSFNSLRDSKCIATPPHGAVGADMSHMTISSVHSMNDDAKVIGAVMGLESLTMNKSELGAESNKQQWIHQWIQEQKKQAVATISSARRSSEKRTLKSPTSVPASLRLAAANVSSAKKSTRESHMQWSSTKSIASISTDMQIVHEAAPEYMGTVESSSHSQSHIMSQTNSMLMNESLVSKHELFDAVLPSTPITKDLSSVTETLAPEAPNSCISAAQALLMIRQKYASKSPINTTTPGSIRANSTAAIPTSIHRSILQSNSKTIVNSSVNTETTNSSMVSGYMADHYVSINSSQAASQSMVSLSPSPYKIHRRLAPSESTSESEFQSESEVFFSNPVVDFGDHVAVGALCRMKAELCNTSDFQVHLTVQDPSLPFVILHNNITIQPKSYVKIPIRFIPALPGKTFNSQLIVTMQNHSPIILQLKGKSI